MSGQTRSGLAQRPPYEGGPEALLPEWALAFYSSLRRDLLAGTRPAESHLE